jgi:hypothetical protein
VERVKADLRIRDGGADGAPVLAAHVDRHGADGGLAVAELVEEALQSGAVAARRAPHDGAAAVIGDRGQEAVTAPVADLIDADAQQAVEAVAVEVVGDDALHDCANGAPADPQQPGDRRERHLLAQPGDRVLEVRACDGSPIVPTAPALSTRRSRGSSSSRSSHSIMQRVEPTSRCRQRLTRRPWMSKRPVWPQVAQTRRRRRSRTVTTTLSEPELTSMTDAPGRHSSRLNAVVTRTSPSSQGRGPTNSQQPARQAAARHLRSAQPPKNI